MQEQRAERSVNERAILTSTERRGADRYLTVCRIAKIVRADLFISQTRDGELRIQELNGLLGGLDVKQAIVGDK